ncbi:MULTISPECIES: hypothetical protein [unclassified Streptomyces]|uniref:hypothetical protein n=1 Tax=unclassified Streptomyces TaxID=2593676 RepID=UPI003D8FA3A0
MTGANPARQRTRALVVRAGPLTSQLSIRAWIHGQITVSVATDEITAATGLSRSELPGTELSVTADLAALSDTDVLPRKIQLPAQRRLQAA